MIVFFVVHYIKLISSDLKNSNLFFFIIQIKQLEFKNSVYVNYSNV